MWAYLTRNTSAVVVLTLLVALGMTWLLRSWHLADIRRDIPLKQDSTVTAAARTILEDFHDLQTVMLQQAASIASSPRVIEAFSELNGEPSETLLRYLETVDLPARSDYCLLLNTDGPDRMAWPGYATIG